MVRAHIRKDGNVVVLVSQSTEQDPAPRGLKDGCLDRRIAEHGAGAGRPGRVARLNLLTIDVDATR